MCGLKPPYLNNYIKYQTQGHILKYRMNSSPPLWSEEISLINSYRAGGAYLHHENIVSKKWS